MSVKFWKRRWKWAVGGGAIATVALILVGTRLASPEPRIPTSEATRATFEDFLPLRGEIKARRSIILTRFSHR
jgi:hypothetical protein